MCNTNSNKVKPCVEVREEKRHPHVHLCGMMTACLPLLSTVLVGVTPSSDIFPQMGVILLSPF